MFNIKGTKVSILAGIIIALVGWSQDKPVASRLPINEEQLSVYQSFLDGFSFLHVRNLANLTVPFDFKGFPEGRPCLHGIELGNLREPAQTTHTFGAHMLKGATLTVVDGLEQRKLLQKREELSGNQKEKPTENAQATSSELDYLVLSEIAFDSKHQFAVLKYLIVCGQHCLSGATLVMEKVNSKWAVSSRRPCAMFVGN